MQANTENTEPTQFLSSVFGIFRRYCNIMYIDAACCYQLSSVVCRSVTLVSPAKTAAPIEMPFGLRTCVDPGNHVLDGRPNPLMGKGNF